MTPFRNPQTPGEENYNAAHIRTRGVVERTFGIPKSCFRCLDKSGGTLLYSPNFACQIIRACCMLHIFAERKGLEIDIRDDLTPEPDIPPCPRLPRLLREQQSGVVSWNVSLHVKHTHSSWHKQNARMHTIVVPSSHTPHHIGLAQVYHAGLGSSNATPRLQLCC